MALPGQRSCITLTAFIAASPAAVGGQPHTTCQRSWVWRTRWCSQVSSPSLPACSTGSGSGSAWLGHRRGIAAGEQIEAVAEVFGVRRQGREIGGEVQQLAA